MGLEMSRQDRKTMAEIRNRIKGEQAERERSAADAAQKRQWAKTIAAQPAKSPGAAGVLSLFLPGAGQIYNGDILVGLLALLFTPLFYILFFPVGMIIHIATIVTAYSDASKFNRTRMEAQEFLSAPGA